jgi:hypothetical protein
MFTNAFTILSKIEQFSNKNIYIENWSTLSIEGIGNIDLNLINKLVDEFERLNIRGAITFFLGETKFIDISEFKNDFNENEAWRININKNTVLTTNSDGNNDHRINFFFSQNHFVEWIKQTNPFSPDYFANNKRCKIFLNGLKESFGGGNILVCSNNCDFLEIDWGKYDEETIRNNIHIIGNVDVVIKPQNHYIAFGEVNSCSKYFFRNSILVLLASLSNDFYHDDDNLIIRGFRRLPIKLGFNYDGKEISKEYQDNLLNAVKWVYEENERSDLRLKLLLERISLDIDIKLTYFQGLFSIIQDATIQAKERYSFITYERKDQYSKELKELLKDVKSFSDLFSSKIRIILSNLLRDVLAALVLIGITQMSKISELQHLFNNNLLNYVFKAFGFYFIISVILQFTVDFIDVFRSYKELGYWRNITREYMSNKEYKTHMKKTICKRMWYSIPVYAIIMLLYVLLGILCFNINSVLSFLL